MVLLSQPLIPQDVAERELGIVAARLQLYSPWQGWDRGDGREVASHERKCSDPELPGVSKPSIHPVCGTGSGRG